MIEVSVTQTFSTYYLQVLNSAENIALPPTIVNVSSKNLIVLLKLTRRLQAMLQIHVEGRAGNGHNASAVMQLDQECPGR